MSSTEIATRFPAHEGYASRRDIPTFTDMTSFAFQCYSLGLVNRQKLAEILHNINAYQDNDHWYNETQRGRALLMADCMGHLRHLVSLEMAMRRVHARHCWTHGWHTI